MKPCDVLLWMKSFCIPRFLLEKKSEDKQNFDQSFCRFFQAFSEKQYRCKNRPKIPKSKNASKQITLCQPPVKGTSCNSSVHSGRSKGAEMAGRDKNTRKKREKRIRVKGKTRKRVLYIHCYLLLLSVFINLLSIPTRSEACSGRFVNPITDILSQTSDMTDVINKLVVR